MNRWKNEYERAMELSAGSSTGNSRFNVVRRFSADGERTVNYKNILISGQSRMKINLLLNEIKHSLSKPIIVISDSQRSTLSSVLQNYQEMNFCFVRHSRESAYYNFLRHKNTREMLRFFTQTVFMYDLFGQHRIEAELLLQCILQLSVYSTNVFAIIAEGRLNGEYMRSEINRQTRLAAEDKADLIAKVNSSITAAQSVSAALNDVFYMMNKMRGFPFSVKDIVDQKRHVCFCLDGNMAVRGKCWYLAEMLAYDLHDYLNKSSEGFILVLDINYKDKLNLFTNLTSVQTIQTILNIHNVDELPDDFSTASFSELYIFSHSDINSARYWSNYFATRRIAEYTYASNYNTTNKHPLLPFSVGEILGDRSKGESVSSRMVDKPVFEINEIRELKEQEFIYYNHSDRRPVKYTMG